MHPCRYHLFVGKKKQKRMTTKCFFRPLHPSKLFICIYAGAIFCRQNKWLIYPLWSMLQKCFVFAPLSFCGAAYFLINYSIGGGSPRAQACLAVRGSYYHAAYAVRLVIFLLSTNATTTGRWHDIFKLYPNVLPFCILVAAIFILLHKYKRHSLENLEITKRNYNIYRGNT